MLFDVRSYTVRPGTLPRQLALYEELGYATQVRHLGKPFAFLLPETGNINLYTHIWSYQDAADRERRRAAMKADPAWQHYVAESAKAGYFLHQENRLMTPAEFTR